MPINNLLECSENYSMRSGSLWNHYRDEINDSAIENNDICNRISSNKNRFFEYKVKIIRSTPNNNDIFDAEVNVSLKYLSNFWRSLDLPLINCEIEIDLPWSKECIMSEI